MVEKIDSSTALKAGGALGASRGWVSCSQLRRVKFDESPWGQLPHGNDDAQVPQKEHISLLRRGGSLDGAGTTEAWTSLWQEGGAHFLEADSILCMLGIAGHERNDRNDRRR